MALIAVFCSRLIMFSKRCCRNTTDVPAEAVPRTTGWVRATLRSQIPSLWPTYSLSSWHKARDPVVALKLDTIWAGRTEKKPQPQMKGGCVLNIILVKEISAARCPIYCFPLLATAQNISDRFGSSVLKSPWKRNVPILTCAEPQD